MNRDYEPAGGPDSEGEFYIYEWLIQPEINRIVINGSATQVQPRIMQVLVCLAEQPGKVVTRERLFEVVWADTNVSEHV
ncbi:MAG TPA: winged helix-turn-helix domain-containing protein, partial [Blastocatellia bacterium]|nr:winged helix-turn-helix domain-containing protein [Blastocatellia bacterium]